MKSNPRRYQNDENDSNNNNNNHGKNNIFANKIIIMAIKIATKITNNNNKGNLYLNKVKMFFPNTNSMTYSLWKHRSFLFFNKSLQVRPTHHLNRKKGSQL